jgi:Na+/proline symporter
MGVENGKLTMFNWKLDPADRSTVYAACAFALFMYLPGYTTSQVTAQRYVCMSGLSEARRALFIHAVTLTLVCLLFFLVGTTLFAYYHQPGAGGFPELAKQDQLMPYFVANDLRVAGLTGLLLAGLFAAAMSTMDSGINSLTAVVAYDWLAGRELPVLWSRLLCAVFGCLVIVAALLCPLLGDRVIGMITRIAGTFLGLLLGVFLLGMFVPHANAPGALIGLAAGAICLAFVWTLTDIPHWWFGAFTVFPTLVVGGLASTMFLPPTQSQRRGLFFQKTDPVPQEKEP